MLPSFYFFKLFYGLFDSCFYLFFFFKYSDVLGPVLIRVPDPGTRGAVAGSGRIPSLARETRESAVQCSSPGAVTGCAAGSSEEEHHRAWLAGEDATKVLTQGGIRCTLEDSVQISLAV